MLSDPPALKQMLDVFETYEQTVVGVQQVQPEEVSKYGIISALAKHNKILQVRDLIEKPTPASAPSNIAIMGRYILKPTIFPFLKTQGRGAGNEYQLTDALREVCHAEGLLGLELKGDRYDIGDKFGYMKAIIEMGLQREELQPQMIDYLQQVLKKQLNKKRLKRAAV
ncbi:UTP--glucose-1-phosphate uridylyltransferase [Desulfosporosinus sp. OT]|nr:UTP--glucose-1-phosphate uridylyltransferase [Desulfosporosinus sp. OT]